MKRTNLTPTELARLGGLTNLKKYGKGYYKELARKSVAARKARRELDPEYMRKLGKLSAKKRAEGTITPNPEPKSKLKSIFGLE